MIRGEKICKCYQDREEIQRRRQAWRKPIISYYRNNVSNKLVAAVRFGSEVASSARSGLNCSISV